MQTQEQKHRQFEFENLQELARRLREIRENALGTQLEAEKKLNLNQTLISRYENGRRKPPLNYIRQLSRMVNLPFIEEQYLLGLAGVTIPTRMPSPEQIKRGMEAYSADVQRDWYPCIIVDHLFGIWALNNAAYDVLGEIRTREIIGQYVTIFEMMFSEELDYNPQLLVYQALTNETIKTRLQQIAIFKLFNIQRRHEAFYRDYTKHLGYIGSLKPRINAQHFLNFWNHVDIVNQRGELQFKEGSIEIKGILPAKGSVEIRYRQRLEPIPHLPSFAIIRFEPFHEFYPIFEGYKQENKDIIRLWDIQQDIRPIIQSIDKLNLIDAASD
jgi:transcriptional regulator with XRE-family HTH domain